MADGTVHDLARALVTALAEHLFEHGEHVLLADPRTLVRKPNDKSTHLAFAVLGLGLDYATRTELEEARDRLLARIESDRARERKPGAVVARLVSGLRGPAWRDAEIERLEADGWRRASEPCVMYGSVWVEKEVDE